MINSTTGAPASYEELFAEYFGFVKGLVAKAGIEPQDVEQVAMSIITKFLEKDALSWYDPEKLHDVGENPRIDGPRLRKARFSSLLGTFVKLYVRQHLDKQAMRSYKEPIRCETPIVTDEGVVSEWLELNGSATMLDTSQEFTDWVASVDAYLRTLPVKGQRDLPRLFRLLVEQVIADGVADRKAIAREFGVSDTAVHQMVKDLRATLRDSGWVGSSTLGKAVFI